MQKKVSITDICNFQGGNQPPKSEFLETPQKGYIRLLQIRDFENDSKAIYIEDKGSLKKCLEDDILLARYGASVGKVLTGKAGAYNVAMMKITPNELVLKRFMFYVLKSYQFQKFIKLISESRAAQAGFNKTDLSRFYFYLPSIEKQEIIIAQLDTIQSLIDKRFDNLRILDNFLNSFYYHLFGDPVKNQKKFNTKKLKEIVNKDTIITYGIVQAGPNIENGIPYIKSGEIKNGSIKSNSLSQTSNEIAEKHKKSKCNIGDIIISIRASIGECAIVPLELDGVNLTRGAARVSPNANIVDRYYLFQTMSSEGFKFLTNKHIKGSTFKEISLSKLREIKIPVPNLELQSKFSETFLNIMKQKELINKSLGQLQGLFQSLLQNAFKENVAVNEEPVFIELIKKMSIEDLRGDKKRLQYLINLFKEKKFEDMHEYSDAKEMLFVLIAENEITQKFNNDTIELQIT
ncbi:hypothetical protein DNC80_15375 [Flavobacterium sp. SOK18b]|uniref:restriction endonuclease subunit S n=1 Tax=Flavobacterium sp. SOK18b TaxID=797900 RepID=UPI0015FDB002|nr:restriction endonuclease subunit S [Flavobacterium sp. SOK18b]MBB1195045.1 hypothetical protein [Flavobacterium sp. SOK18b]